MAVPSPTPRSEKDALRRAVRKARMAHVSSLGIETRHALEEQLAEHLSAIVAGATIVAAYVPIGTEISPAPLLARARRLGKTIAYPAFDHGSDTFRFRAGDPVMPGPHRIQQPGPDAPEVIPDLVLVPLIACGPDGTRLGQGKGHYDRALAGLERGRARFVGLGWKVQRIDDAIPADEWDVALDGFACPRFLEWFGEADDA
ncbi:5-formyltetrahydrofolate cyclo-ligase [Sphingomicrobium nitratireducens]|uniref:5-formyltetrahydrofolate cyclo-ligase n=1 Tax=Sphingomicrobium nitratireducens TaxID=2964666 RepID=UPI00223F97A4|nr:5-formyltetrahydrofolate cyclo-ligase [Sphingomicrobium nitratireducens]